MELYNLLCYQNYQLVEVSTLCGAEPGNPPAITDAELVSGAYLAKFAQAARQSAYAKLCQD